jgi:hypothetical protein
MVDVDPNLVAAPTNSGTPLRPFKLKIPRRVHFGLFTLPARSFEESERIKRGRDAIRKLE